MVLVDRDIGGREAILRRRRCPRLHTLYREWRPSSTAAVSTRRYQRGANAVELPSRRREREASTVFTLYASCWPIAPAALVALALAPNAKSSRPIVARAAAATWSIKLLCCLPMSHD